MSQIRISNSEVISRAKIVTKIIQEKRLAVECQGINNVNLYFDTYTASWVYSRKFGEWFKYFGPFALIGLVGYPFSVVDRFIDLRKKPDDNSSVLTKLKWIKEVEGDSWWVEDIFCIESRGWGEQLTTVQKLKCMAENNEDDFMILSREEAEALEIC